MEKKKHIFHYNIELLRFLFIILIVRFHSPDLFYSAGYTPKNLGNDCICVEFFFMIAGFILFNTFNQNTDTWKFLIKKFLRLAPNLWLFILIMAILSCFIDTISWNLDGNILKLFLLHEMGLSKVTGGSYMNITWFISVFFWVSLFYFYICKTFKDNYRNLIIWIISITSFSLYLNAVGFQAGGHENGVYSLINIGILRGLGAMGFGYFIHLLYERFKPENISKKSYILFSTLEIFCIYFLGHYLLFTSKVPGNSSFVFIVVFAILFYLFLIKQGFLSKLLENKVFENIGKTSYSIYCFHPIILAIICKYIIPNNIIPITEQTTSLLFGLYITASILLGMLLYHIFEKPMSKFFSKKIDKII